MLPIKAGPNRRRIRKELRNLLADPPPFCRPGPSPVTDLLHWDWEVVIDGPEDSSYAGGTFTLDVQFPCDYPFSPTKTTFKTKVYHPNVDSEGQMFLDTLDRNWSPAITMNHLRVHQPVRGEGKGLDPEVRLLLPREGRRAQLATVLRRVRHSLRGNGGGTEAPKGGEEAAEPYVKKRQYHHHPQQ